MKKKIHGWLEREIREIKREVYSCMEREKSKKVKSLKKEWAKQMEETEVRVRELTEKGRESEVKFEQLEGKVREKIGSNRREESEQEEAKTGVSGKEGIQGQGRLLMRAKL